MLLVKKKLPFLNALQVGTKYLAPTCFCVKTGSEVLQPLQEKLCTLSKTFHVKLHLLVFWISNKNSVRNEAIRANARRRGTRLSASISFAQELVGTKITRVVCSFKMNVPEALHGAFCLGSPSQECFATNLVICILFGTVGVQLMLFLLKFVLEQPRITPQKLLFSELALLCFGNNIPRYLRLCEVPS